MVKSKSRLCSSGMEFVLHDGIFKFLLMKRSRRTFILRIESSLTNSFLFLLVRQGNAQLILFVRAGNLKSILERKS